MRRVWITVLGILNIVACGSLVGLYYYGCVLEWRKSALFTWGLPILVAAILTSICIVYTLKKEDWRWAAAGLFLAGAGWSYFLILSWFLRWAMV
jgi:hypothetical protein